MFGKNRICLIIVGLGLIAAWTPAAAWGQDQQEPKSLEESWQDLLDYIALAQETAALAEARYLISGRFEPRQIYDASAETRDSRETLHRGMKLSGLGEPLQELVSLIEKGYLAKRSDPQEISRAIEMLGGTLEGAELGTSRLVESGEFALPLLIARLSDPGTSEVIRSRIITLLPEMGKPAVRGLSVALLSSNQKVVKAVATALGKIGYPHAAPRLKEALNREDLVPDVEQAVRRALVTVAGQASLEKPLAEVFYNWGRNYYNQNESLMPDPRNPDTGYVWFWDENAGQAVLQMVAVPDAIFPDIYAMRMARKALEYDADFSAAVPLWIKAFARREVRLPAGANDPLLGPEELHAPDYILATSPRYLQQALGDVLEEKNSQVAFMIIQGLAQTQGAKSLVATIAGGAQPLVAALTYPDRRVRYLAAISLAQALPTEKYNGHHLVLPVLNQALRRTGKPSAVLISAGNELTSAVREAGYTPIQAPDAENGVTEAVMVGGVDAFVLEDADALATLVQRTADQPMLLQTPIIVVGDNQQIRRMTQNQERVLSLAPGFTAPAVQEALSGAMQVAAGPPMDDLEANLWAIRAAAAVETVARSGQDIYDESLSVVALESALKSPTSEVKNAGARALGQIDTSQAQRAVASLALASGEDESIRISAFDALSASLRKFGNLLEDDQAKAIVDLVLGNASRELRNAASKALGAANLPSERIQMLILRTSKE